MTTRTGAQIWVDYIRPDTDEPVPTILIASPYDNTLGRGWKAELKEPHQGPSFPTSPGVPLLAAGPAVVPTDLGARDPQVVRVRVGARRGVQG